ncbi:MAG: glycoside hydrolase family 3 N-terminal domain-containing protein [Bacteroidaceae bacterium]
MKKIAGSSNSVNDKINDMTRIHNTLSIFLSGLVLTSFFACSEQHADQYQSYSQNSVIENRVDSLLHLMTLEEKIGQLNQFAGAGEITGPAMQTKVLPIIKQGLVGSMFNEMGVEKLTELQHLAVDSTRLGIPILFAADVVHGYKTIFPINLASAGSWNLDLIQQSARIAAQEASSEGIAWTFAPMVDITRDPRWGRVMEGAGEDTYLGAAIAQAYVRGYQGTEGWEGLKDKETILACTKHFAAYGAVEGGREYNTVELSELTLRNDYFAPYLATKEAGVATFMTAFNDVLGVPASANQWLYKTVLRDEWAFKGLVVTDYTAIMELTNHGVAADTLQASELAINAGIDMDMTSGYFLNSLKELVAQGRVSEARIDQAVSRVLEMKFLLGLFDDPYRYLDANREKEGTLKPAYLATSRQLAQQSIVLLKNKMDFFPIDDSKKETIAVIGPLAQNRVSLNGEWAIKGDRQYNRTIWEKLQERYAGTPVKLVYALGCAIDGTDQKEFSHALRVARNADKVLFVGGEDYNMSGEAASRTNIKLPGQQQALLQALQQTGKPIGLVLCNGRPLNLSWEDAHLDGIIEAWYLGSEAGAAIADVISGDSNPSGHLTMSFPRTVGQIPVYYNHKNTGRPLSPDDPNADYKSKYIDCSNDPLYPFGYGLSYTSFELSEVQLDKNVMTANQGLTITCTVTNQGKKVGTDVVQLYVRDLVGSITLPVKELKGFKRIELKAGESKKVTFVLNESDLRFFNTAMEYRSEPGDFSLWVAHDAEDDSHPLAFSLQ